MTYITDIHIRDPFILPVQEQLMYHLYSAAHEDSKPVGFDVRTSLDLLEWSEPKAVFRAQPDFWADRDFWAPEVHYYHQHYYLFASFKAEGVCRGTQILRSDSSLGPFAPISAGPVTPLDWECLDGTLFVSEKGTPWMVFCHEWAQIRDGSMCAMPLTADLMEAAEPPHLLFSASQAPWVTRGPWEGHWVTDGPSLYRTQAGALLMVWSSFTETGYSVGIARSDSGTVLGPWQHEERTLFNQDGGHGSVFKAFDGRLILSLHQPNSGHVERAHLFVIEEADNSLRLGAELERS
jgi:GH43 family beta-xylosidase